MANNKISRWVLFSLLIIICDLAIKYWVKNHFAPGEVSGIMNNFLYIGNIKSLRYSTPFNNSLNPIVVISKIVQAAFLLFFIRVQTVKNISQLYKIAALLILSGLAGNYVDMFLLSEGSKDYLQLDYLNISKLSSAFFNLCSLLSYIGLTVLITAIIRNPGDIKKVFSRQKTVENKSIQ
jgi:lipoprotein signal peptidase